MIVRLGLTQSDSLVNFFAQIKALITIPHNTSLFITNVVSLFTSNNRALIPQIK